MSTATELLSRALNSLNNLEDQLKDLGYGWLGGPQLREEIETFLAAEPEADKCKHRIADARNPVVQSGYVCVDCHALFQAADHQSPRPEPARKPMTEEEIKMALLIRGFPYDAFRAGVRFAEKHHGIGGDDNG